MTPTDLCATCAHVRFIHQGKCYGANGCDCQQYKEPAK